MAKPRHVYVCSRDFANAERRLDLGECMKAYIYFYPRTEWEGNLIKFIEKSAADKVVGALEQMPCDYMSLKPTEVCKNEDCVRCAALNEWDGK